MALIAHYKLDGNAKDSIGNTDGNPSSPMWANGKIGKAADMRSSNWWITGDGWNITSEFSYSFWAIKTSDSDTYIGGLVGNHYHTGGPTGCNIHMMGGTSTVRIATGDGTSRPTYTVSVPDPTNEWQHYVLTYKGNTVSVFQNGVHIDSRDRIIKFDPSRPFAIGRWTSSYDSYYLNGMLNDVRIYDHALSEKEIYNLANGPVLQLLREGMDNTSSNNSFTVDAPAILGSTSFSFWFYPTTTSTRQTIWDNGYGGEGTINWETSGFLRFYSGPNGGNSSGYTSSWVSNDGIPLNQWHHAVCVRNMENRTWQWYINGDLDASGTHSVTSIGETTFTPTIGSGYTSYFRGMLRDFNQYAVALSADDAKELYRQKASLDSEGNFHVS